MPETQTSLTLAVGDRVVYPNQGVCLVFAIATEEIAGHRLTWITMKREEDGSIVKVPQGKVQSIGLRKIAASDEVGQVFTFLKSDSDKANLDWKQRARTNQERMSQGSIVGLAEVVKGLQVLSELRPLPTKERELYDNARHLLVAELAASQGIAECDAEDSLDIILFPVGKDRPKRTAAEFRPGSEDDEFDLGGDLLELGGGELDLASEEGESEGEEAGEEAESGEEEAESTKGRGAKKGAKKPVLSDDDETMAAGRPLLEGLEDAPAPKKRGRPPKPKPILAADAPPPAPKKRGRPPKPKPDLDLTQTAAAAAPKKRGRPPKSAAAASSPAAPSKPKKK